MRKPNKHFVDLTGQIFGKLLVLRRAPNRAKYGAACWVVRCGCNQERIVRANRLIQGVTKGCRVCSAANTTHGLSKTLEYKLWLGAKMRAAKRGLPFTIQIADVKVPARCPLLGQPLERGTRSVYTASLDQIRPGQGYVPGNVWVISWRANQIKSDLTLAQLEKFVAAIRKAETH